MTSTTRTGDHQTPSPDDTGVVPAVSPENGGAPARHTWPTTDRKAQEASNGGTAAPQSTTGVKRRHPCPHCPDTFHTPAGLASHRHHQHGATPPPAPPWKTGRRCADPQCRRPFRPHRAVQKYCHPACANRASSRRYRNRRYATDPQFAAAARADSQARRQAAGDAYRRGEAQRHRDARANGSWNESGRSAQKREAA